MRKLYRSEQNKIFFGVFGGIGEYFDIDPVIIRLIFVALTIVTGGIPGILFYIVAWFIVPRHTHPAKENGVIETELQEEVVNS